MAVMAVCAVIGGLDWVFGNRLKLGERFREGFMLLGPTALSMAGILCLAPALSDLLSRAVTPVYRAVNLDPGMFGGILAIDMGGYTMAERLAVDPSIGRYSGIVVSAILGCTLVFTIPVGMGMLKDELRGDFSRGILWGLAVMPAPLWLGGILSGIGPLLMLKELIPVIILCGLLMAAIWKKPEASVRAFRAFAKGLDRLITLGLIAGAVQYMTGWVILPGLMPLEEAMGIVSSVGIVLLGSLPMAQILTTVLKKPLSALGRKLHMNAVSMSGFLVTTVSLLPTVASMDRMDSRGRVANAAAAVCSTAALAAHLGFAASQQPDMLTALLVSKFAGALLAAAAALITFSKSERKNDQ